MGVLLNIWISFLAGLFAPLGAVCVLPLYPGFLAYLASKFATTTSSGSRSPEEVIEVGESLIKKKVITLGLLVSLGVVISMFIVGLVFSKFFSSSLTNAIGIISPIAFGILGIVSLLMIFNFDFSRFLPKVQGIQTENPYWGALGFGLFFGLIVLPCNPASLVVLFAISSSVMGFVENLFNFLFFGIGMAIPLLVFSVIAGEWSQAVLGFLTKWKRAIYVIAGLIMLAISVYYLVFVFGILGILGSGGIVACTEDAKVCPDGSVVVRTGENCEFEECPIPCGGLAGIMCPEGYTCQLEGNEFMTDRTGFCVLDS